MNWLDWIYSFFCKSKMADMATESINCEENSATQQSIQAEPLREISPKKINNILAKIRNYDILEDADFEYIQRIIKN